MKKNILSVGLILLSFQSISQTGGLGGQSSPNIYNDPSGAGFGAGYGGVPPTTSRPGATIPSGPTQSPTPSNSSVPQSSPQQQMEDRNNFAGGSMSGEGINQQLPSTEPRVPSQTIPGTGTGFETGTGTGTTP